MGLLARIKARIGSWWNRNISADVPPELDRCETCRRTVCALDDSFAKCPRGLAIQRQADTVVVPRERLR